VRLLTCTNSRLHPSKAGPLFVVKSILSSIAYIATMIWAIIQFRGVDLDMGEQRAAGSQLG
jgi:NCS1 family nucleobase:cation symporter-1